MTRFNKERLLIPDLHITTTVSAIIYDVKCEAFKMSLSKTPPKSITDLLARAEKCINIEETMFPRRDASLLKKPKLKKLYESNQRPDPFRSKPRLRAPPNTLDRSKYCDFHRDHGHMTEGCFILKQEIEALIKWGFLGTYVSHDKHQRNNQGNDKALEDQGNKQLTTDTINIIIGGTTSGGTPTTGVSSSALVISDIIANFEVRKILVNDGTATNVLLHEAFVQMGISLEQLKPVKTPLQVFEGGVIIPKGIVRLPFTLGLERKIKTIVSTFHLAMKFPTSNGVGVVRGNQTVDKQCYVTRFWEIKADSIQLSSLTSRIMGNLPQWSLRTSKWIVISLTLKRSSLHCGGTR
ncbi:unnamed protein product [Fraxinus pennsylvanica]|uniref:Uncharacterized protein n=1 Tax=Fraxinus pennsylvanica TaxID=56036 RepID=A0AAD1ZMF7_9LAMI|nr:unnamed protein product [Fraxinus pennsylvanica]